MKRIIVLFLISIGCVFAGTASDNYGITFPSTSAYGVSANGGKLIANDNCTSMTIQANGSTSTSPYIYLYNNTGVIQLASASTTGVTGKRVGTITYNFTKGTSYWVFFGNLSGLWVGYSASGVSYPKTGTNFNLTSGGYISGGVITPLTSYMYEYSLVNSTCGVVVSNSCTYTSGNWTINVNDDCNITSAVNMNRNVLTINGSTTNSKRLYISTAGSVKNYSSILWTSVNTTLWGLLG
jgi:hypothetical protein